jgi:hypothetical protein
VIYELQLAKVNWLAWGVAPKLEILIAGPSLICDGISMEPGLIGATTLSGNCLFFFGSMTSASKWMVGVMKSMCARMLAGTL